MLSIEVFYCSKLLCMITFIFDKKNHWEELWKLIKKYLSILILLFIVRYDSKKEETNTAILA